jgi:hypothetical protein
LAVNEFGFHTVQEGEALGSWVVAKGQVDAYNVVVSREALGWRLPTDTPGGCEQLVDINGGERLG